MPNIQTKSTLGDLGARGLGPAFEKVFEQNLIKYEGRDIASKLFAFLNTDKSVVRDTGLTGYNLLSEFTEGTPIPRVVNTKTFETQYSIRDYGGAVEVTENMLDDRERLGKAFDEMANLAKSSDLTEIKGAFAILNAGTVTTAKINGYSIHRYNDEALFSASHARADGGSSQSNLSAGSIALSELNLETGRLALVKQLSDNGLPVMNMGAINLVVPSDLEKNAVIFSQSQLRSTTADNDLNFYATQTGKVNAVCSKWLNATNGGSATRWFLIATLKGLEPLLRVYRKGGPSFYAAPKDGNTRNQVFSVKNRFAVGNSHWLGSWASSGS